MRINDKRGLTIIETAIAMAIVATCLVGVLGTFVISRLAISRAKHQMMAMNMIRAYMEQEIGAGYAGGFGARADSSVDTDYYKSVDSGDAITFVIDQGENLSGNITADPYPAETHTPNDPWRYKKVGFKVQWDEKQFGGGMTCTERAAAYVADHS